MTRLVQLAHARLGPALALVDEPALVLVTGPASLYEMLDAASRAGRGVAEYARSSANGSRLDYDAVYAGRDEWALAVPVSHPEPARCLVSGTGLTHRKSADNRNAMHTGAAAEKESDSLVMYRWGIEGGRPAEGAAGVAPEWFYKGTGAILRAHNEPLDVPWFAGGGGDEAEIAGVYWIDPGGAPRRIGMVQGNEFSDHVEERRNYLYLAPSKLRTCSIGPELVLNPDFSDARGRVRILRAGAAIWAKALASGEANMCHSLANLEHHHFKYPQHRRPGDLHIHFFGADAFSSGEGIRMVEGDEMEISFAGFGRPLRNPVRMQSCGQQLMRVMPM